MRPRSIWKQRNVAIPHEGEERDGVVVDAADALTLNQEVQWERCEKLARPADRRALGNLRALGAIVPGDEPTAEAAAGADTRGRSFAGRAAQVLIGIAVVEVALGLLLLPWGWESYRNEQGEIATFLAVQFIGHAASACLLMFAGRRDRRTWLLGVYCLLEATHPLTHMLPGFILDMPPPEQFGAFVQDMPASARLFYCVFVPSFLFAPAFLWLFARECPRVHRRSRLDDLARRMVPLSVGAGFALWIGCGVVLQVAQMGYAREWLPMVLDGSMAALDLLALAAVVVVALRAHTAPAEEVRRVVVFSAGLLLYMGRLVAYNVGEAFAPGHFVTNYEWSPAVAAAQTMRFPGMVLLWYSVLAVRVPHVREVVRACCRWPPARPGRLRAAAAAPVLALAWLAASRPERTVGALFADPLAQSLLAAIGIVSLLALAREPILRRIDAWTHPEAADQKRALATATAALAQAGSVKAVKRAVTRAVKRGCGSPAELVGIIDPDTHAETIHAPDAAPLARTSAIVHMMESAGGTLRVHPADESSLFKLLPHGEAVWVVKTAADAIVPVPGRGDELLGALVVGRRFDDRLVRPADIDFLEVLGATAGLALGRLGMLHPAEGPAVEAAPARVCPECGCVVEAGGSPECGCGSAYVESEVPKVLAGKFRLMRRLGVGGMGAVYLARDLRLERNVAVKTVTGLSTTGLLRLKPEAWAMAEISHPGVAQIHAVESWRGHLFLVAEYLAGGTLADRLKRGPVPEPEAVSIANALADALAALHDAGYLHGDVKPSNIGFTAAGSPKLLDFGLARESDDAGVRGGTLRYASPEVLSGRPAEEADDVWSLAVVLYEMAWSEHPFARSGTAAGEVMQNIRRRRIGAGGWAPTPLQSAAAAFAASVLSAPRSVRPSTAKAFAHARTTGSSFYPHRSVSFFHPSTGMALNSRWRRRAGG